jgi:pimeloyl-ACP methyl ester carboxylesterase
MSGETMTSEKQHSEIKREYAHVNGLKMYYEIHGHSGRPLVLLHGGAGATEMYDEILPILLGQGGRQIIGTDLQAHGRTADIERPLSYETLAEDLAAFIRQLNLPQVDLMGYSLGGGVALRTAIQHPGLVKRRTRLDPVQEGWMVPGGTRSDGAQCRKR